MSAISKEQAEHKLLAGAGQIAQALRDHPAAFQALNSYVSAIVKALPTAMRLGSLNEEGLFEGFLSPRTEGSIALQRLTDALEEKRRLADFLMSNGSALHDELSRPRQHGYQRRIFFESGTTVAVLIGRLARSISGGFRNHIITNNTFALTALVGLADRIEPIQGMLSTKYYGLLPFSESPPSDETEISKEYHRYLDLVHQITDCDLVFAACSNFSFLAGPLVGSRANALVKHAMYSGREAWDPLKSKEFILLLHAEKVVPCKNWLRTHTFEVMKPTTSCCCVFNAPPLLALEGSPEIDEWRAKVQSRKADDEAIEVPGPAWTVLFNSGPQDPHPYVSVPIQEFASKARDHKLKRFDSDGSWLEAGKGVTLAISLPTRQESVARQFITEEIEAANGVIRRSKNADYKCKYEVKDDKDGVVLVSFN